MSDSLLERSGITLARLPGPGVWQVGDHVSLATGPACGVLAGLDVVGFASEVDAGGGLRLAYFPAPLDQASHLRLTIVPDGFKLDLCPGSWHVLSSLSVYIEVSFAGRRYSRRLLLDDLMDKRWQIEMSMAKAGREVLDLMEQSGALGAASPDATSEPPHENGWGPSFSRLIGPKLERQRIREWPEKEFQE